ncbi:MAG: hypothetical protein P4M15_01330 [Alphaproteobacteria bacterium]|nr:hypothetical protein [Alphaproteobacteria bacterium]
MTEVIPARARQTAAESFALEAAGIGRRLANDLNRRYGTNLEARPATAGGNADDRIASFNLAQERTGLAGRIFGHWRHVTLVTLIRYKDRGMDAYVFDYAIEEGPGISGKRGEAQMTQSGLVIPPETARQIEDYVIEKIEDGTLSLPGYRPAPIPPANPAP